MLGLFPQIPDEAAIQASLAIPLEPARGSGEPTGTGSPLEKLLPATPAAPAPAAPAAATVSLPGQPARRDLLALRHEASFRTHAPQ
jgi:hypothetical protein